MRSMRDESPAHLSTFPRNPPVVSQSSNRLTPSGEPRSSRKASWEPVRAALSWDRSIRKHMQILKRVWARNGTETGASGAADQSTGIRLIPWRTLVPVMPRYRFGDFVLSPRRQCSSTADTSGLIPRYFDLLVSH